ncbi:lysM domain receptor-like kinase 4 [Arachis stenosperma]|uniref:lysM domain receptor-like kinase 4 n=1 Tax=Arachis stenosperma TaxID=217475 RepID=UPI0025ACCDD3|nr:lysM domain receptor-like kinase 4 [Arachis stenosperma]
MDNTIVLFTVSFLLVSSNGIMSQQNYSGNSVLSCSNNDTEGPSSDFLYTCNGFQKSCLTFLIFKSQTPHNTIATISNLTSSNPEDLARFNNATHSTLFRTGKEVIVPLNCSCPTREHDDDYDEYYQAQTTYVLPKDPTYFTTAKDTFQGLTTCDSLQRYNPYGVLDLHPGMVLHVPLICACPTARQAGSGTKYLLTYSVNWGDNVSNIATRFHVNASSMVDANGLSSENEMLYPFTIVLIPLTSEPNSTITKVQNGQPPSPTTLYTVRKDKTKTKRKRIIVALTSSASFLFFLFVVLSLVFVRRKRLEIFFRGDRRGRTKQVFSEQIREGVASIELLSKVYKFDEIKEADENFSASNRIKGSVYRGVFGKEREIMAIKKMNLGASKEVNLLGRINHFNLIKLEGYCEKDGSFYLVFEYMENDPCYVHKAINTDNILLNKDLRAKIANFTLAKESDREVTSSCSYYTSHVVGTRGYMAPEYLDSGRVTSKMDVYAFGVVLLELITGKDSIIVQDDGTETMLSSIILNLIDKDDAEEKLGLFIDPSLMGNSEKVCAIQLVKLSLACLVEEPSRRPNMAEVVSSLLRIYTEIETRTLPCRINDSGSTERLNRIECDWRNEE